MINRKSCFAYLLDITRSSFWA